MGILRYMKTKFKKCRSFVVAPVLYQTDFNFRILSQNPSTTTPSSPMLKLPSFVSFIARGVGSMFQMSLSPVCHFRLLFVWAWSNSNHVTPLPRKFPSLTSLPGRQQQALGKLSLAACPAFPPVCTRHSFRWLLPCSPPGKRTHPSGLKT